MEPETLETETPEEEPPAQVRPWLAPLAATAAGAVGGALGVSLVTAAGPLLGGCTALAVGGALVSRAVSRAAGEEVTPPAEPRPEIEASASQEFADGLLASRSLVERVRLLLQLHAGSEGIEGLEAVTSRCFLRLGEESEVYFLGSEVDLCRPEAFADSWLHTNARIQQQPLDPLLRESGAPGAQVHQGFQERYLTLSHELLTRLASAHTRKVSLIGYSLGGAMATLAALHLCHNFEIELITFGSPRVGNERFRSLFAECRNVRVARFVNTLDLVPHVPFNPEDVADQSRQDRLWRRLEQAMLLPQSQIATGNYVHVAPATVLDGLSSGLGLVSRLAAVVAESERLPLSVIPVEFIAEHSLRSYLRTLQDAPRPAWLCLSSTLLRNAPCTALWQLATASSSAAGAVGAASGVEVGAASGALEAIGAASGALEASAGVGLLLPQLLSSAVSAVGCYCVAQRVSQVSQQLQEQSEGNSRTQEQLQLELGDLRRELSRAQGGVLESLQSIRRGSCDDVLRRARVAQRHLWEEVEVFLANPTAAHAQMVREGCRELRKAAAEVLEMTEEADDAAHAANLFKVVLSAHRLALWASALADASNAPLRAAQALLHVLPLLGKFFWRNLATGQESWLQALEVQRVYFLSICMTLTGENPLDQIRSCRERFFAELGLDPGSRQLRESLGQDGEVTDAAQQWLQAHPGGAPLELQDALVEEPS